MFKNNTSRIDNRGYNQGFKETPANLYRLKRRALWIMQKMNITADTKILEIGCGDGYMAYCIAKELSPANIIASDLCIDFINDAREKYTLSNLCFEVLDFNTINKHEKFDYIIGNGILHHLYYDVDKALSNIKKLLTPHPDSKMIFIEPNIYNPYIYAIFKNKKLRKWAHLEPDEMAFSKTFIEQKLRQHNYKNIHIQYIDFLIPGMPMFLVKPITILGAVFEKTPLIKNISQSILITAQ